MTNKESLKYLNSIVGDGSSGFVLTPIKTEVLQKAITALERVDKYEWHDLRKNPNDLPVNEDDSVMYECVLENHVHDASYPAFYFCEEIKAFGYPNSQYAVDNGANDFETIDDMEYEKVIAWREIEPFEEE